MSHHHIQTWGFFSIFFHVCSKVLLEVIVYLEHLLEEGQLRKKKNDISLLN